MVVALHQNAGLPLITGLPADQMLPGRVSAQTAVGLPRSLVQVEPRGAVSQAIFHSGVPCVPD